MNDFNGVENNLELLDAQLDAAYARRSKHLLYTIILLFGAILVTAFGLMIQIIQTSNDTGWKYSNIVLMLSAPNVFIIISVIVGLVLHGNTSGRIPSKVTAVFSAQLDMLKTDLISHSKSLFNNINNLEDVLLCVRKLEEKKLSGQTSNRNDCIHEDYISSQMSQLKNLSTELEILGKSAARQSQYPDLALGAYGFSILSTFSCASVFMGTTEGADLPRILLLAISAMSSMACYIIFSRPTNLQVLTEDSLEKLGISLESITNNLNSKNNIAPKEELDHGLFKDSSESI